MLGFACDAECSSPSNIDATDRTFPETRLGFYGLAAWALINSSR